MNILKVLIIQLFGFAPFLGLFAQTDTFRIHRTIKSAGISVLQIHDDYLSQLNYSGLGVRYEDAHTHLFANNLQAWNWYSRSEYVGGLLVNDAFTASMQYVRTNQSLGINRVENNEFINLFAGLNVEYEAGFKYLSRNINNPISVDMNADLNLHLELSYSYSLFGKELGFSVIAESPLLGAMFVPEYLDPYFNSFDFGQVVLFSSLHNKSAYSLKINNEIKLKQLSALVSLYSERSRWEGNNLKFSYYEFGIQAALKFDYALFGGFKKLPPSNAHQFWY